MKKLVLVLSVIAVLIAPAACRWIEIDPKPVIPDIAVTGTVPEVSSSTLVSARPPAVASAAQEALISGTTETLRLTIEGALVLLLQNNPSLDLNEINPALRETSVQQARAEFDPTVAANYSRTRNRTSRVITQPAVGLLPAERVRVVTRNSENSGGASISERLPIGTDIGLNFSANRTNIGQPQDNPNVANLDLTITQSLLRGFGLGVNLANLRQAKIDVLTSEYELRGFSESLVAQLETAYWDYYLAQRQIEIVEDSLSIAEAQFNETLERINVGKLANTERYAAESEVAVQREALINARSAADKARINLLQLINPPDLPLLDRNVVLLSQPVVPDEPLADVNEHVALALRRRPDLNQAKLSIKRDEIDIVRTKNGVLPQLDVFINLGRTGYADSFGESVDDLDNGSHSQEVGVQYSYPLGNRAARAQYRRSLLTRDQAVMSMHNMDLLAVRDVRNAYIEVNRVREQVSATRVTRELQEQTLLTEQEKFRVGKSTPLLVAQAQRDLLTSQIAEVQAFVNYVESLIDLYRLEGSLLDRRGISAPGTEPVEIRGY